MALRNDITLELHGAHATAPHRQLFGIGGARYIVATDNDKDNDIATRAKANNIAITKLGAAKPMANPAEAQLIIGGQSIILFSEVKTLRQTLKNKIYK